MAVVVLGEFFFIACVVFSQQLPSIIKHTFKYFNLWCAES